MEKLIQPIIVKIKASAYVPLVQLGRSYPPVIHGGMSKAWFNSSTSYRAHNCIHVKQSFGVFLPRFSV
ncbi:hypothetical protein CANTEDRAFT_116444 [Yamadazyma tenuis ATCC 10573]|uniref:Uncharacterized protein n=1 Tax=Candida tenuis (strain ATCC 10573 / BCRC 21748 / CBS 615 / JCM 9827 / NBRC 10315 / NRRL Y-1498 / VKM Y-70) TaxID=590646 RepID=G3BDV7_CANTC|nr:uncharacterized protein CANTEDRAFT_116444 [Yamadazyma tenuis ATCC 10573]EGV60393.1 hypothetical protein CANTEDRAFT_116444 [Yamadazyma tenuis ATCC 10573]